MMSTLKLMRYSIGLTSVRRERNTGVMWSYLEMLQII